MTQPRFEDRGLARPAVLLTLCLVAPLTSGRAMPGVRENWTTTLTSGTAQLWGAGIGVDASDSLYVTGSNPYATIVTARLDSSGSVLWQVEFDNPGTREQGAWLALDPAGDVVVTGYNVAGASQDPAGFVTLKYDSAGNLLWSDVIPMTRGVTSRVASDASGNVIVLGSAWVVNSSGNTTDDLVTIKYAPDGTRLWTRTAGVGPTSRDAAGGLAVDAAGNVYVTGGTLGMVLTEAYDPNGNLLWSRQVPSVGAGLDIALGSLSEIYVSSAGNGQMLVVKLDPGTGTVQWAKGYPGVAGSRLKTDSAGNVVVTGYTGSGGYTDWRTHKLSPDGTLLWSATYDQHAFNDEFPYALTIGPDDEIYVTGQGGPGPQSGNLSYLKTVTVRYSPDGVEDWAAASALSVRGLGVVRLSDNSIATVGHSTFTVFHYGQTGVWTSLGGALDGMSGTPRLSGTGSPASLNPVSLELSAARPSASLWVVVGLTQINLPLQGGVLVPFPDFIFGGLKASAVGSISLPFQWPAGMPSGFETAFQVWILDAAGPSGLAASNGLLAVSE